MKLKNVAIQLNFLLWVFSCILHIAGAIYQPSILTHHRSKRPGLAYMLLNMHP